MNEKQVTHIVGDDVAFHDPYAASFNSVAYHIQNHFNLSILNSGLFQTEHLAGLYDLYLTSFTKNHRQHHTCHCCKSFIERFGGLVVIDENGNQRSALWPSHNDIDPIYALAMQNLSNVVEKSKVIGPFYTDATALGAGPSHDKKRDYTWTHFHVKLPYELQYKAYSKTPVQAMAAKVENYNTIMRALSEFSLEQLQTGVRVLEADELSRSDKFIGPMNWLLQMKQYSLEKNHTIRRNLLWRSIASASEALCHPRSGMIGTLLEDLAATPKLSFEQIRARFNSKMGALDYQRPKAAPSANTIAQAEKLVEQMGLQRSLLRRVARLDDLKPMWLPTLEEVKTTDTGGGVFAHLQAKKPKIDFDVQLPTKTITWRKFTETALFKATKIQVQVAGHDTYGAFTTAVDPTAPPLLQWDHENNRNPVAYYIYMSMVHGQQIFGCQASKFGITPGWIDISAICATSDKWDRPINEIDIVTFILPDARDKENPKLSLFPENMRSELHGVRSVIEAHSNNSYLQEPENGNSCCVFISKNRPQRYLRCLIEGHWNTYHIDRWD